MLSNPNIQTEDDDEKLPAETLEQLHDKIQDLIDQLDKENNPDRQAFVFTF
jgi:hypothetical protein